MLHLKTKFLVAQKVSLYQWTVPHPSTIVLKRCANQSQTSGGTSLGSGQQSLYQWSIALDQDYHHANIGSKPILQKEKVSDLKLSIKHMGTELYIIRVNHDPKMTMAYFTGRTA